MKKHTFIFNLLGVVLCGLTVPAAAADCFPARNDCCEWSFCDGKIRVGADWLYWKVMEDGLNIGSVVESNILSQTTPIVGHSSTLRHNFKYDSGFRVHLGYELPCDCWDVDVSYTYLPSHAKTAIFTTNDTNTRFFVADSVNYPSFGALGLLNSPTTLGAKWNLTANSIDVDLGRTVCFGECLKIRPHVGFRTTWFDQKLRIGSAAVIVGGPAQVSSILIKEKFNGYGVEGGLWGEWQVGCGLSVVGHVGGSVLYSKFRIHQDIATVTVDDEGVEAQLLAFTGCDTIHAGTPTVDYFVGLQYADCFCDMLVSVHAGWEQHVMFDVNRLARDGNLSTQGLTLGLDVGF